MDNQTASTKVLTVIVTDKQSQRAPGASVSLEPSGARGETDSNGEIQFNLGTSPKYEVTVKLEGDEVTVPYYVTRDGATRLMVNPNYVQAVEKNLQPSIWPESLPWVPVLGGLGVVVVLWLIWRFIRKQLRRARRNRSRE